MRSTVFAILLAACSKLPERPPMGDFMAMTADQQCDATAPRATQCADELTFASLDQLFDKSDLAELHDEFRQSPRSDRDEARAVHEMNCQAERKAAYQKRVFDCWNKPDCDAFASCVYPTGAAAR